MNIISAQITEVDMDIQSLISELGEKIKKEPYAYRAYEGYYSACRLLMKENTLDGVERLVWLSDAISEAMPTMATVNKSEMGLLYALHKKVLLAAAPYDFDSYLLYVEWNREPSKKFYAPRRKQLKIVVDALQDLEDDKLALLAVSMPPGTGKST